MNDDKLTESVLWKKGYRINSRNEWYLPPKDNRVSPTPEHQPDTRHEPVGKGEGKDNGAGFRIVRIASYRVRLVDERNLYDKYVVDALVRAKLLRDDTPQWCRIEVRQVQVNEPELERTEIEIIAPASAAAPPDSSPPSPSSPCDTGPSPGH